MIKVANWMKSYGGYGHRCFILTLVLVLSTFGLIQGQNLEWVNVIGNDGQENGLNIVVDKMGNSYSVGYFSGTVDFDPGYEIYNLTSKGKTDAYILKTDREGKFVWALNIGSDGFDEANKVTLNSTGGGFNHRKF